MPMLIAFRIVVLMVITSSAMSFAGVGHKMEIKQQTHAQRQLLQAFIAPDGSMEESGHSGATADHAPQKISLNFGGSAHGNANGGFHERPELSKSTVCSANACHECRSKSGCWHGSKYYGHDGFLRVDVPPNRQWTSYITETWARCGNGGGTWLIRPFAVKNGLFEVYVNGGNLNLPTLADWPKQWKRYRNGKWRRVTQDKRIDIVGDARITLSFRPGDTTKLSKAVVMLMAHNIDMTVDRCMAVKDGLAVLGDGSEEAFELRNFNRRQFACLVGNWRSMSASLAYKCRLWRSRISPKQRYILIAFLSAALNGASSMAEVRDLQHLLPSFNASRATRASCNDPAVDDPESWDCECLEAMANTCKAKYSNLSLENCLRTLMCYNPAVCQGWKHEHCQGSLVEGSASQSPSATISDDIASVPVIQRRATMLSTKTASLSALDSSTQGKCTTSTRF